LVRQVAWLFITTALLSYRQMGIFYRFIEHSDEMFNDFYATS
jgi:hypothetical protein